MVDQLGFASIFDPRGLPLLPTAQLLFPSALLENHRRAVVDVAGDEPGDCDDREGVERLYFPSPRQLPRDRRT